jgi:hypothetical protein
MPRATSTKSTDEETSDLSASTRVAQGLPPKITSPAVIERVAAILDRAER